MQKKTLINYWDNFYIKKNKIKESSFARFVLIKVKRGKVKKSFMVYGSKSGSGDNYLVDHSTFTYLISNTGKLLWHFKRQDKPEEIKNRIECIIENED